MPAGERNRPAGTNDRHIGAGGAAGSGVVDVAVFAGAGFGTASLARGGPIERPAQVTIELTQAFGSLDGREDRFRVEHQLERIRDHGLLRHVMTPCACL